MSKPDFRPFPEQQSEEIQEIVSRPPPWLIRSGTTLFFIIFFLVVSGTWWVRYQDIIQSRFTLTSVAAPRVVVTRSEGRIQHLYVKDGEYVAVGRRLAFIESTAEPLEIHELSQSLDTLIKCVSNNHWSKVTQFQTSSFSQLGEIQNAFTTFNQQLTELKSYLPGGFYLKKADILAKDRVDLEKLAVVMREQQFLQQHDLALAQEEFAMQEKLYKNQAISQLEFKRERGKLITREMPLRNLESSIIQNSTMQLAKQKESLELQNAIDEKKATFLQSLNLLRSAIEGWEQKYLIVAPLPGKVSFLGPWQTQQHVGLGQELVVIEPDSTSYRGIVKFSQASLGKVKVGQRVYVKLDGFPFREYGVLDGLLANVSATPGPDSLYWGYVTLPNNLTTHYGRTLTYRNGLKGQAEVITTYRRLANRLVELVKSGRNN